MAEIDSTRPERPTFGGLASGLDTGALVSSLMQLESRPLAVLERRRDQIKQGQEAIRKFNTLVLDLRNAARDMDNRSTSLDSDTFGEEFLSYKASSGDEGVLSAEASSSAAPGSYRVHVASLAAVARRISTRFSETTSVVGSGSFQIDFGGDAPIALTLAAGSTLSQLRDAINSDSNNDNAVRADLISDGTGYRLVVAGVTPGAANDVTITTGLTGPVSEPFIDATLGNAATDASLSFLGLTVTRDSNDVTDLIPGVTLALSGTNAVGEEVEVDVARDDDAIAAKAQKLVDAFNAVHAFVKEQQGSPDKPGGPLRGDSLLQTIERQVRRVLGTRVGFGDATGADPEPVWASDIGIRFEKDGTLKLNAAALKQRLADDPELVKRLLSGIDPTDDEANDGVATAIARALHPILDTTSAAGMEDPKLSFFKARENAISERLSTVEDQITRFETRLAKREEFLRRQFANLETLIAALQGQSNFLNRI